MEPRPDRRAGQGPRRAGWSIRFDKACGLINGHRAEGDSDRRATDLALVGHGTEQVEGEAAGEQARLLLMVTRRGDLDDVEADDLAPGGDAAQQIGGLE